MKNFYFTYGMNHLDRDGKPLGNCYTVIQGETEKEVRDAMYEARGLSWAFDYTEAERKTAIDRWNLKERSLESVTLPKEDEKA